MENSKETKDQSRINKLIDLLTEENNQQTESSKNKADNILNLNVNNTTNNMINDVISSFEKSMNSSENGDGNPFKDIMNITNMITEKYQNDIESGEIDLDGLLGNIQNQIPGMSDFTGQKKEKEKTIIDENFSTADVPVGQEEEGGFDFGKMMKMMNSLGGAGGLGEEMSGLFEMMSKAENVKDEKEAEELQKQMNDYMENKLKVDLSKKSFDDQEKVVNNVIEDINSEKNFYDDNNTENTIENSKKMKNCL